MYNCPSDERGGSNQRAIPALRGNYMINWGNITYGTAVILDTTQTGFAPFSNIDGNRATPRLVKFSSITDGLSNTLMMSNGNL